jgi:ABC-2 type transport system ATP-binding protein
VNGVAIGREPFTGPAAIRTSGLSKRYGARTALNGLDLVVPEGSIYLLAGPNGSGKSTAMRQLLHLEQPDAGTIEVLGCDVRRDAARARARIGYVADEGVTPYKWLRVGDLIAYHARYYPTWDAAYAARLVAEFKIDLQPRVSVLSRGQTRRIAFVLALAHRPALLLFDEPTDALDPVARDRLLRRIAAHAADTPTTLLISTHLIYEVERLADQVGIIQEGKMAAQLSRERLRTHLNRYRFDAPDAWRPPDAAPGTVFARSARGRENDWTIWGDQQAIREMLYQTGTEIRSITPLTLADAVIALLAMEDAA